MKNINYIKKLIWETVLKEELTGFKLETSDVPVRGDIVIARNMGNFYVVVKYGENLGIYKTIKLALRRAKNKLQDTKNLWYTERTDPDKYWKYTK